MEEKMKTMEIYKTRDLFEAAFLYGSHHDLIRVDQDEGERCWFVFDAECKSIALTYWQGRATVNAKDYSDAIRTLKDIIFSH